METRIVKSLNPPKSYGFIVIEGSEKDIFFHKTSNPIDAKKIMGKVSYDIIKGPKKPSPIITRVLDGVSERELFLMFKNFIQS